MPSDLDLLSSDTPAPEAAPDTALPDVTPSATPDTPLTSTPDEPAVDPAQDTPPPVEEVVDEPLLDSVEEPLSVKALNDKLTKSPELQAAMAKDPGLRNLLFATARQAQQVAEFKEIFQTPAVARSAMDLANRQIEFENSVRGAPHQVAEKLFDMTAMRDAQGNVIFDQPNPEYAQIFVSQREQHLWPYLNQVAAEAKNEDQRDAIAIVAAMLGDKIQSDSPYAKGNRPQQQQQPAALDPETQARLQRLDELENNQQNFQQQQQMQYQQAVVTGISDSVSKAAGSYLDNLLKAKPNVVVTDFIRGVVLEKSVNEIYELAKNDVSYQNHINFLFRSSPVKDEALKVKLLAEATKYARERLPKVIAKHIGEASKGVVASQQQRLDKQSRQAQRPEVQGTAGVSAPSRQDPAEAVKAFISKNKRRPTDRELLDL